MVWSFVIFFQFFWNSFSRPPGSWDNIWLFVPSKFKLNISGWTCVFSRCFFATFARFCTLGLFWDCTDRGFPFSFETKQGFVSGFFSIFVIALVTGIFTALLSTFVITTFLTKGVFIPVVVDTCQWAPLLALCTLVSVRGPLTKGLLFSRRFEYGLF